MKEKLTHHDMRMIADLLKTLMPPNYAFTLLTFETNVQAAEVLYISSAEREDMKATMQTMINKWEAMEKFKNPNPN